MLMLLEKKRKQNKTRRAETIIIIIIIYIKMIFSFSDKLWEKVRRETTLRCR